MDLKNNFVKCLTVFYECETLALLQRTAGQGKAQHGSAQQRKSTRSASSDEDVVRVELIHN